MNDSRSTVFSESQTAPSGASRDIILDVRSLQDVNYAARGVGRHALNLLRHAPRDGDVRLIGLMDPALPALGDETAALLDIVVPNAYAAERALRAHRPELAGFVSLSPMTHAVDFTARLHANPMLLRTAIVYDFIPRRAPERYLPSEVDRLRYAAALRWLARCDQFAAISRSAADDLCSVLSVPASLVAVTGCGLAAKFLEKGKASDSARHVLVVGGGDPRKNPEVVIRAHAGSKAMQGGKGVLLLIGGGYSSEDARRFRALAVQSGGRYDLVEVAGHVSDNELHLMYRDALAVISPSRDEGFSLPIIEGMASGALCMGSDIPAHRELIEDPGLRFDPNDDKSLRAMLDRVATDSAWREGCVSRQQNVWQRFRCEDVAGRFWRLILGPRSTPTSPAILHKSRPRVALLTPLPPDRSGVADYSAASCADLGRLVDLHVFSETAAPSLPRGVASVRPLSALPHLMPEFDRVISVVGNSHFHVKTFEFLQRYGGACIAHDARMLGFYRILLGHDRALAAASKELGRPVGQAEMDVWLGDEGKLEALFLGEIAQASAPMIVHSSVTAALCAERYGITPTYVPFSIYRPWLAEELTPAARLEARQRMGVAATDVVITTFGFVHPSKAPEECVRALDRLRSWGIRARLHFVGDLNAMPSEGRGLMSLIEQLGLHDHVRLWHGFVSEQDYRDHLVGSDMGIQLRTYGLGALSGALLDCAAAGLPSVSNESLIQSVGVPGAYMRAIPDAVSPMLLAEALAELLEEQAIPGAAIAREGARADYSTERSFATYANRLCRALHLDVPAARA